jgi:hypothetical protein
MLINSTVVPPTYKKVSDMSEEMMNEVEEDTSVSSVEATDELQALKARADLMGIKYHPNTGVDKLRAKINNALEGNTEEDEPMEAKPKKVKALSSKEFQQEKVKNRKREADQLVRCRITCMNPSKKDWEGEIISVGSAKVGTYKKYVPFNAGAEGWHIPKIMYEFLKERKCSVFQTVLDNKGNKVRRARLVPEFAIEILPPLNKEQLKELARKQAMAGGTE